jgi:hypothetical protein
MMSRGMVSTTHYPIIRAAARTALQFRVLLIANEASRHLNLLSTFHELHFGTDTIMLRRGGHIEEAWSYANLTW